MKIAYIIFDGITWLDFIGVYDAVSRLKIYNYLPDLTWDTCSFASTAADGMGLTMVAHKVKPNLKEYDVIVVPGGHGTRKLQEDETFIQWLRTTNEEALKISVCTGSFLLGAAGYLAGKRATTNYNEY